LAKVKPSKSSGKAPITRHPLFPATVALWFGALFGIGSLAIRPSLIEGFVTSLAIDAIIPTAAPPLGATTRILLALTLAAIGGTLGAWLARRIASPKPVQTERRRAAAKAGQPLSPAEKVGTNAAGRRGRLALDEEAAQRQYVDHAPLPGGGSILDVSQFELEGFETDLPEVSPMTNEPESAFQPASPVQPAQWSPAPVAQTVQPPSEPFAASLESVPESDSAPEWSIEQDHYAYEPENRTPPAGAQVFQPIAAEQPDRVEPDQADDPEAQATDDGELAPAVFVPTAEPQEFAADVPAADEAPFMKPESLDFSSPERPAFAMPEDYQSGSPAVATPDEEPAASVPAFEPDPVPAEESSLPRLGDDSFEPLPARVRPGSIFDRKPAPSLFAQPHQTQVSNVKWDSPILGTADQANETAAPVEQQSAPEPRAAPVAEPVAAVAAERIASAALDELSHVELLERLALSMRRKRSQAETAKPEAPRLPESLPTDSAADVPPVIAPPVPHIPDALRPVGLDDEDDGDLLPAFVPPRHFVQPTGADAPTPAEQVRQVFEADLSSGPEPAAAESIDEGYSSLLSLSRPGAGVQRFVRIEEPASPSGEIEPVVIFPGKEPGATMQPAANVQAVASAQRDPDETDRALRTALANLQRMSGAA